MKLRYMYFAVPLLFIGCASYKQLQPKPVLSPAESGYIELKNGKKILILKKTRNISSIFPLPRKTIFTWYSISPQKNSLQVSLPINLPRNLTEQKLPTNPKLIPRAFIPSRKTALVIF